MAFIGWSLATLAQFISLHSLFHGYLISFLFLLFVLSLRSSLSSIASFLSSSLRSVGQPKKGVLKDLGYSLR